MQKFGKKRIISKIKRKFSSIFPSFWVENREKFNRKISSRLEKWKLDKMHITAYCWNVIKIFCYFLEDKWYQCEGVRGAAESVTFLKFSRRCPLLAVETTHQILNPSVTWKLNSMCSVCGTIKPSSTLFQYAAACLPPKIGFNLYFQEEVLHTIFAWRLHKYHYWLFQ